MPGGALLEVIYCSVKPYLHPNHRKLVEEKYCVNVRFLIIMKMSFHCRVIQVLKYQITCGY